MACSGNALTLSLTRRGVPLLPLLGWGMTYGALVLLAIAAAQGSLGADRPQRGVVGEPAVPHAVRHRDRVLRLLPPRAARGAGARGDDRRDDPADRARDLGRARRLAPDGACRWPAWCCAWAACSCHPRAQARGRLSVSLVGAPRRLDARRAASCPCRRRSFDARVGAVAMRRRGNWAAASISARRRSNAAPRLRGRLRCSCALIVTTPSPPMRWSLRARSRAFSASGRLEASMSKRSTTAFDTLLTF